MRQFADPLACFRELVQNAIDAGSGEVEIDFEHQPAGEGSVGRARGMAVAQVRDFGEGMTRELIEQRLTRLFSSGKGEDFTKIGRFGIGFVSVFALEPAAVCVDTGRTGEYWRVLFGPERDYELLALEEPVEGTDVRLFVPMDAEDFAEFRHEAREAIVEWCRHAAIPVIVDGEDIREPVAIEDCAEAADEGMLAIREGRPIWVGFGGPPIWC